MPPRMLSVDGLCTQCRRVRLNPRHSRSLSASQQALQHATTEPNASVQQHESIAATLSSSTQSQNLLGSRRRRAALRYTANIPFEQLPYQCFQEARKILQEDRQEKLTALAAQRSKIQRLEAQLRVSSAPTTERFQQMRLVSLREHLVTLKIHADINDPLVKKTFEDGHGDMNKPVYRHLARKKWEARRLPIMLQRINQMNVIPDVLQSMTPRADVSISFGRRQIAPGAFVSSAVSEQVPRLSVQVFDAGERLISVAIVDADVPNLEKDGFDYRCHFLASNIPISPTTRTLDLGKLEHGDVLREWLPPFAQKGSPYHRLSVFVLEQKQGSQIDADAARARVGSGQDFVLRSFVDRHDLKAVGVNLFRTVWDEHMDALMTKLGVPGAGEELKRKKVEPLPYKWKPSYSKRYR